MFKESATNLHGITVEKGIEWLQTFDTVLSDCDGEFDLVRFLIPAIEIYQNKAEFSF